MLKFFKSKLFLAILFGVLAISAIGYKVGMGKRNAVYIEFADICLGQVDKEKQLRKDYNFIFDQLRNCVHKNSVHNISEEYYETAKLGRKQFANNLLSHIKKPDSTPPHMECSKRSSFLFNMYKALGYKAESIVVVQKGQGYPDHVAVRIQNPKTKEYQVQDATFDVYYKNVKSNKRLDIYALLKQPEDEFEPCGLNGVCGWDKTSPDKVSPFFNVISYWGAAYLDYSGKGGPLIYNPSKFDVMQDKMPVGDKEMTYCEKKPYHCEKTLTIDDVYK